MPAIVTPIYPGDRIVGLLDSIQAHDTLHGNDGSAGSSSPNFFSLIEADFAAARPARVPDGRRARVVGGVLARAVPVTDKYRKLIFTNSGVSGNRVQDLDVPSRVTAFSPSVVIWLGCVNDVNGVFGAWNASAFMATFQAKIAQIYAENPAVRLIVTSSCFVGESYTLGSPPVFGPNVGAHDADIEQQSGIMRTIVEAAGGQFKDLRNPGLIQWEVANNLANDPTGHLLKPGDGLHPGQLGARTICGLLYNSIRTVP